MAASRESVVNGIARKVGATGLDVASLEPDDFVAEAVALYDRIRPRRSAAKVAGNATYLYALSLLPGFDAEFSELRAVEYPIDQTPSRLFLDREDFGLVEDEDASNARVLKVRIGAIVQATEYLRFLYTARHTLSATVSTVPDADGPAVSALGASFLMRELAARLNRDRGTVGDVEIALGIAERAAEARRVAEDFEAQGYRMLGATPPGEAQGAGGGPTSGNAVSTVRDVDHPFGRSRGGWLTHPSRER